MNALVGRMAAAIIGLVALVAAGAVGASATAVSQPLSSAAVAAPKPPVFAPLVPTKPGSGKGLTIGYISLGESIAYIHTVTKGIQKNAKIAGAKVIVCD